jgi:hypothetical protein
VGVFLFVVITVLLSGPVVKFDVSGEVTRAEGDAIFRSREGQGGHRGGDSESGGDNDTEGDHGEQLAVVCGVEKLKEESK